MSRVPVNVRIERADGTIIPLELIETELNVWQNPDLIHIHDKPWRVRADLIPPMCQIVVNVCTEST